MKDLIELTPTESFLQNADFTMTLKDVADKYKKEHRNLTRDFKQMIVELSGEELDTLKFEQTSYIDEANRKQFTFNLDFKTVVWFVAKFDHSLRLKVVNFAFAQLEQSNKQAIEQAVKVAKAPKVYEKGYMSVRGCIGTVFEDIEDDVMESDVWDALVWNGLAVTRAKVTVKRELPKSMENIVGDSRKNMAVYDPLIVRNVYDKWIEAGKPRLSEYERLTQEFEEISKYYKDKLSKC